VKRAVLTVAIRAERKVKPAMGVTLRKTEAKMPLKAMMHFVRLAGTFIAVEVALELGPDLLTVIDTTAQVVVVDATETTTEVGIVTETAKGTAMDEAGEAVTQVAAVLPALGKKRANRPLLSLQRTNAIAEPSLSSSSLLVCGLRSLLRFSKRLGPLKKLKLSKTGSAADPKGKSDDCSS